MSVKLSNRDYCWSYIGVFLSLSANIIMVPFIMHFLDGDHYGLWGVFQSLAGITVLFDFGFSTTFGRNINYCWNGAEKLEKTGVTFSKTPKPNYYLMKKTMTACQRIFLLISGVALILMLSLGTLYISYISSGIDTTEPIIAWVAYAIAIFLNLYYGYFGSFLQGVGAIADLNKTIVISKATQIIVTILFLWLGFGLIGTGIAYLTYGTLYRFIAKHRFYEFEGIGKGLKEIKVKIPGHEVKDMFITVWYNAWREGLVSLSNYLSNQACTIIVSLYMPLTQTGAYSLGVQICTAVAQVAGAMYRSNQPVLQAAYIRNDKNAQKRTMSLIVFSFVFLDIIGMIIVTSIGLPILRLIRPEIVIAPSMLIALGFYHLILNFRNCYTSYFSCTNRIPYVKAFLISSIICIILAYVSMSMLNMGMWGIIAAQLISQLMYNAWIWMIKAHKELNLKASETINMGYEELMRVIKNLIYRGRRNNA